MDVALSKKISFYNFLCTVFIVMYHSKGFIKHFIAEPSAVADGIFRFCDALGYFAMGSFFAISGYLFYVGLEDRQSLTKKIKKRLYSLGVPFLAWNTVMLIETVVSGWSGGGLHMTFEDILWGYSFYTFAGGVWYLLALILLMVLSPVILLLKTRPKLFVGIILVSFAASYCVELFTESSGRLGIWFTRLAYYVPIYLVGAYAGLCGAPAVKKSTVLSVIAGVLSAAVIVIRILLPESESVNWIALHIAPFALWLMFDRSLFAKMRITYPMKVTFFVYTLHMYLIDVLTDLTAALIPYHSLQLYEVIPLYILFVTVLYLICMLFSFVAKKLLPKTVYAALSGGRVQ